MFQLRYANYEKFEDGKLKALVPRIAFFIRSRGENREKFAMRFARRGSACRAPASLSRFRSPLDIPRPAKSRGETSASLVEERAGGRRDGRWRLRERETRSKMGLELQISLFSVPPVPPVSPIYLFASSSTHRPLALTPEHVRGAPGMFQRIFEPDDKSSDFAGFKFVTRL